MKQITVRNGTMRRFSAGAGESKSALIICPGGGYEFCSIREGAPVARAFAGMGIESFILEYNCEPVPLGRKPLYALASAVACVRRDSEKYGISPDRIAVGGFSAGAHLAGLLGAVWNRPDWFEQGIEPKQIRPNALVMCYPVVTAGEYAHRGSFERLAGADIEAQQVYSLETLAGPDTPPTFLWHTLDDDTVPVENSLLMESALRKAGVPHEVHLFPHGVHGLSLADLETYDPMRGRVPDRHVARWAALCAEWLKNLP